MKNKSLHIIQQQEVEIHFDNLDDAIGIQNRMADLFYEKLQPAMDNLFDELVGKNDFLKLDKLEIDCGILSDKNWEAEWVEHSIRKLRQELISVQDKESAIYSDYSMQATESLLFFLENGYFPWNNRMGSIAQMENEVLFDETLISRLKLLLRKSVHATERLSVQFSDQFREKVIREFTARKKKFLQSIMAFRENLTYYKIDDSMIEAGLFRSLADEDFEVSAAQFFSQLYLSTDENVKPFVKKFLDQISLPGIQTSSPIELKEEAKQVSEIRREEPVYITNAGLVILHPFLPELFEHFKLIRNDIWTDKQAQHKAAIILQYLVSGEESFPEFDMPLNKVLCGIDLEDVVVQTEKISNEIKSECDRLLQKTIDHWRALKNTSVEALRETFLQRNGQIQQVDNGWLLRVEQKALDVLLSYLPWGMGIIKLPWMEDMLYVEWT